MAVSPKPRTPAGLEKAGSELWKLIAWVYPLRPDEKKILRDACFAADIQAKLEGDIATEPVKSIGSQGQEVINPTYTEWRQYSSVVQSHLLKLRLPDEVQNAGQKNRQQAELSLKRRAAVRARWDKTAQK